MMETVIDPGLDDWPVAERDWENNYLFGLCKGERYARLHLQFKEDVCYIHLYVERWSLEVLREMRQDFECLRRLAQHKGAKRLVGAVGCEGEELDRWQRMLRLVGFPEARPVIIEGKKRMMTVMEI